MRVSGEVTVVRAWLASLLTKKEQALVIRSRLKRMSWGDEHGRWIAARGATQCDWSTSQCHIASNIYPILFYQLSVFPRPSVQLFNLVRVFFDLFRGWGSNILWYIAEVCCLHPAEGGLGMPSVEIRQHTLRFSFLERTSVTANSVRKTPAKLLRLWRECIRTKGRPAAPSQYPFYRKYHNALLYLLRVMVSAKSLNINCPLSLVLSAFIKYYFVIALCRFHHFSNIASSRVVSVSDNSLW